LALDIKETVHIMIVQDDIRHISIDQIRLPINVP